MVVDRVPGSVNLDIQTYLRYFLGREKLVVEAAQVGENGYCQYPNPAQPD